MSTRDLINELQNQKDMLGKGFFDQELLEKYLDASYLRKQNKKELEDTKQIELYGLNSIESLQTKLTKIYPYTTAKPRFNRSKGDWNTLYNITNDNNRINITIQTTHFKQKQKTFKQDKAA